MTIFVSDFELTAFQETGEASFDRKDTTVGHIMEQIQAKLGIPVESLDVISVGPFHALITMRKPR